jgi:hypothetical protein
MARVRSPNYPALSLPEAIKLVTTVQAAEQHLAAPKEVVAKHLGYSSYHGKAGRVVSALENYGLLEEVSGDKVKVSDLAMSILFPATPEEKRTALNAAAYKHPLFAAIKDEWHGSRPSDENLRVYLIRRKFGADALDRVIEVYKETMGLVTPESEGYSTPSEPREVKLQASSLTTGKSDLGRPTLGTTSVAIQDDRIVVAATLLSAQSVQKLIDKLSAVKTLLPDEKEEAAN